MAHILQDGEDEVCSGAWAIADDEKAPDIKLKTSEKGVS
jgi:hypothetical protein